MRAVVLGGTGALGGAAALRLASAGWSVDVTGRDASAFPTELRSAGVRFHAINRRDVVGIDRLVGDDTGLLVDLLAYCAADVRALLPVMRRVPCPVMVSSRAVYVDPLGRHLNGDEAPRFDGPIREDSPTLPPARDDVDPFTRDGYAPSKVAAESEALSSGLPVTVLRPSKVHGRWARSARTRGFVEAMRRSEPTIALPRAESVDHLTAAANTAELIEVVASRPGARILNTADPDTPTAVEIVSAIGERLGWNGTIVTVSDASTPGTIRNPWAAVHPVVLDTTAATDLGSGPVGMALDLIREEVDWVAR